MEETKASVINIRKKESKRIRKGGVFGEGALRSLIVRAVLVPGTAAAYLEGSFIVGMKVGMEEPRGARWPRSVRKTR